MRLTGTVRPQTVMLLRQNEIVMPQHQIVIDTHHLLIAMTGEQVAAVAIVTAIPGIIMTQEEIMIQVVITVRGMGIRHQGMAVLVVDRWIKMLMDLEPRWEAVADTVWEVVTVPVKVSKEASVTRLAIRQGGQTRAHHMGITN